MPTTNATPEPKTYSRKRRPKGKIPCVAIGRPRITRTKVAPDGFSPKLTEYRAWIPTGNGKEGLTYISSTVFPKMLEYEGAEYMLVGIKLDGDLVFEKDMEL